MAGMPDAYFGEKGTTWIDLGEGPDADPVMKLLEDGKILLVGAGQEDTVKGIALVRLLPNGLRDKSFGEAGKSFVPLKGKVADMALQRDGKIVLAGREFNGKNDDFVALRLDASGKLDATFNATGKKRIALEGTEEVQSLCIQDDGRIVLVGHTYTGSWADRNFAVVRLNPDGSEDATFGKQGRKIVDISRYDYASGVCVQPDGRIVVAGHSRSGTFNEFVAFRLDANGKEDLNFASQGVFRKHAGKEHDHCVGLAISGSRIFLAGHTKTGGASHNFDFVAMALHLNGQPDSSFGSQGLKIIDTGGVDYAADLLVQPDGRLLVAGSSGGKFAVIRFTGQGKPDPGFGNGGIAFLDMKGGRTDFASCAELQSDGKILVGGSAGSGVAIARLEGNPYLPGQESVLAFDWKRPVSQVRETYMRMNLAPGFFLQVWVPGSELIAAGTLTRVGGKSFIPVQAAIQRHAYFALGSDFKMTLIWDMRGGIHYYVNGVYLKTEASAR